MSDVVIVEAVRTPVGRRGGGLSTIHPADLLATVQQAVDRAVGHRPRRGRPGRRRLRQPGRRAGLQHRPHRVAQRRAAALGRRHHRRHPVRVVAAGHQPGHRAGRRGAVDFAVACGVEVMSRVPIGSSGRKDLGLGIPIPKSYFPQYEMTSQFEGAERIAEKWGITRDDTDAFGLRSQQNAATAWAEDRFGTQIVPVDAPDVDEEGKPTGATHTVARDEGLRETTLEKLAELKPVARARRRPHGRLVVADLRRRRRRAADDRRARRGPRPAATGPDRRHLPRRRRPGAHAHRPDRRHPAPVRAHRPERRRHRRRRDQRGLRVRGAGLAEGARLHADEQVNPNGGAIALGHPLGGTGAVLLTKALHELERTGGRYGLVTMCCGGGLGTGTIIERL